MYIYTQKPTGLFTVYLIINKINNKRYIGIHKEKPNEELRKYMGSGSAIKRAIRNEGVDNFTKIILARFDTREEMMAMEKQLVTEDIANSSEYYNQQTGGGHPSHSEATLEKMREKKQGANHPMYGKTGENHPRHGMTHSEATLEKMSKAQSGKNNPAAKLANIYCYKTDRLIAEGVVLKPWARENGYNQGHLSATARTDRTHPHCWKTNPLHHKGIYAQYV